MSLTQPEIDYLASHSLARPPTVGPDSQPDVIPVAVEFDGLGFWVCAAGEAVVRTRKVRNVLAGRAILALVVDDLVSIELFVARGVRVYGVADPPVERIGMVGPGYYMRVTPTLSWSWNMEGEPVGDEWCRTHRAVHGAN